MKTKAFLITSLIIGILSCKKSENKEIANLVEGTWTLETTSAIYDNLDFNEDMTYKITGLAYNPLINNGIPVETGCLIGEWSYENNKITFLTRHITIYSLNQDIDITAAYDQPIGSFYDFMTDGIFQDTSEISRINNFSEDSITLDSEYSPIVWIVKELNKTTLIVLNGTATITYMKQ